MTNKVVTTLVRAYRDLGIQTLCFNFRGVGKSQGSFDNAIGELDDLLAVFHWVKNNMVGSRLLLAGFSFGSSIAARASYYLDNLVHLTLVAPPIERYQYDQDGLFNVPICVIQGSEDSIVNSAGVYAWIDSIKSTATLIRYPKAGHFFHGFLSSLKRDLTDELLIRISNNNVS